MRRLVMISVLVALLVALFATAALARNFQCTDRPCEGGPQDDVIFERGGDGVGDTIFGRRGNDRIFADRFGDDQDILIGGPGNDRLHADDNDGQDELRGGTGYDRCFGDMGDVFISCEEINGVVQNP
jgi:Ca2+-binding RTX toxin-like protein